jgi:drug/metabolite transporter (DMT)-like permease
MNVVQEREELAVKQQDPRAARRLMILVSCSTVICAAAQILMKIGMTHVSHLDPIALATNVPLVAGYGLYAVFCLMMILALRHGELSVIYPIISLAYIWVTVLSYFIFHDTLNSLKLVGIFGVIFGVAMLGRGKQE